MFLTIEVVKRRVDFLAKCKELDVYSYGDTSELAVKRLKKVIKFYIQSAGEYIDDRTSELKDNLSLNEDSIN